MKSMAFRFTILGCTVVLASLVSTGLLTGQNAGTDQVPTVSFGPERSLMTGAIVRGSATMLVRTRDDITATIHTAGLTPGNVYSAWIAVFNNPRACATQPCTPADLSNPAVEGSLLNMGGRLVGADGVASYADVRAVGDTTNAQIPGPGLKDTRKAQIHLAVRNHGPAALDPATFQQQLSTFNGGCPPNACVTVQAAVHEP